MIPDIQGYPVDPVTGERLTLKEEEHYYTCEVCGQSVDKRSLSEVFHHKSPCHEKLEPNA